MTRGAAEPAGTIAGAVLRRPPLARSETAPRAMQTFRTGAQDE
jgi:hypothetical protein